MATSIDVLLADDRAIDADITLLALRRVAPRLRVLALRGGNEALQYLFSVGEFARRPGGMPRVVLLDAEMPVVHGLCVLEVIRAHSLTSSIPAVIVSSQPLPRTARRNDKFAADAYIVRPPDLALYSALLGRLLRRWLPRTRSNESSAPGGFQPARITRIA